MQFISRRYLLSVIVLVASGSMSLGGYAYATTILNHNVQNNHLKSLAGGFTDDAGTWQVSNSVPCEFFTNPNAGLFVTALDVSPSGTSPGTASVFGGNGQFFANAFVSTAAAGGDWIQRLFATNTTVLTPSTMWALSVQVAEGNLLTQFTTLYFATPASLIAGVSCYVLFVSIDLNAIPAQAQLLTTPLTWTATITKL